MVDRRWLRQFLGYLGPGFLISVAYMDPGNWATNVAGGARYGTALLWVIVLASLMAVVIQVVAAKVGIATRKNIAALCRERFSRPTVVVLWLAAEGAMIATDVAEILGAAVGFVLVFDVPLAGGAVLAAASSFLLLGVRSAYRRGYRLVEFVVMGLVAVIGFIFLFELAITHPDPGDVARGLVPTIPDAGALFIAVGILGATVMPHSVYLHTQLVYDRAERLDESAAASHFSFERADTALALLGAMFVNAAMLVVAAAALAGTGVRTLEAASLTLRNVFGQQAGVAFGVALIAAGLSSSFVATMAGQTVMDGFLDLRVSVVTRRLVTLVPSLTIVLLGFETTTVLVASQVALSFELPFVLVPLWWFSSRERLMGRFVNGRPTSLLLGVIVAAIVGLNVLLVADALFGIV